MSEGPDRRAGDDLDRLRTAIDGLDRELLGVLNRRLELVRRIGRLKHEQGAPIYVPPREKAVLARVLEANPGPFPDDALVRVFREIFSASRRAERPLSAAYAGRAGSLAHAAAEGLLGAATSLVPGGTPRELLTAVARDEVDYAVLPAFQAPEGVGGHSLAILLEFELSLVAEYYLPLELVIARSEGGKCPTRVLVPAAFDDLARTRLRAALPGVRIDAVLDTAEAAHRAARKGVAAVLPRFSAERAGLSTLTTLIGPSEAPRLRYLAVARQPMPPTGADKTTLAFGLVDRAGALLRALEPLSRRRINLDLLTASPAGTEGRRDVFFVDLGGHIRTARIRAAVEEMREACSFVELLGSYPVFDPGARGAGKNR